MIGAAGSRVLYRWLFRRLSGTACDGASTPAPDRTKYEAGFGLPPFEDRGSGYHFAILSRHQPAALKVATHPES